MPKTPLTRKPKCSSCHMGIDRQKCAFELDSSQCPRHEQLRNWAKENGGTIYGGEFKKLESQNKRMPKTPKKKEPPKCVWVQFERDNEFGFEPLHVGLTRREATQYRVCKDFPVYKFELIGPKKGPKP